MKKAIFYTLLSIFPLQAMAQKGNIKELKDIINEYFENYQVEGYRPYNGFQADSLLIYNKSKRLDIYPNESFYSQPFTPERVSKIEEELEKRLPAAYRKFDITILAKYQRPISDLIPNALRQDHKDKSRMWGNINYEGKPWINNISRPYKPTAGLEGRHLMINPSHGRYYKFGDWHWQRPFLFSTCEDLFTRSFVNPFLIPMLENAGAIVCSARERDIQTSETVVDNDPVPLTSYQAQPSGAIRYESDFGTYQERAFQKSQWSTIPTEEICPLPKAALDTLPNSLWAFAMPQQISADSINPFRLGTARQIQTTSKTNNIASATWTPEIPTTGRYAVYVSYASLPNSIDDAHYTVYHNGGRTEFRVNQKMGGGTWVYLGSFNFTAGRQTNNRVVLTNRSQSDGVVTADAVRFGGGISRIARGIAGKSGLPCYLEGARYYTQWSGLPDSLFLIGDIHNDYNDDIRCRSTFTNYLGGGSVYMPDSAGLGVPIEMGIGLHSDAGIRRDSTIYGTMSICTSVRKDSIFNYQSGLSRLAAMDLSSSLLNSVTHDLSRLYGRTWTRRELWDRNYGEARGPEVPSVILEMLSHQNFEDLKYGHDPNFKFDLSRAVYKAILRYVNSQHGNDKVEVQPLPVKKFSALLDSNESSVTLTWEPTIDTLEMSATPKEYVLYTRVANEDFDNGQLVGKNTQVTLPISPNLRYDFKITAINGGGESFPSEVLSVYLNPNSRKEVLIVNGFLRVSGPARIEYPDSVGFDLRKDLGVPYHHTTAFCGPQLDFNPQYQGQEGPGALGFSSDEWVGKVIAGNTFDHTAEHGRAIAACGHYSYSSMSRDAFETPGTEFARYCVIDYIAGLERNVSYNLRPYKTFSHATQKKISHYLRNGGNILVSGAYIGSDMQSEKERHFTSDVLKYQYAGTTMGDSTEYVQGLNLDIPIYRTINSRHYAAQNSDAILPSSADAFSAFLYGGGQVAGIAYPGSDYRVIAMSFPFECISHPAIQKRAMEAILQFLISRE